MAAWIKMPLGVEIGLGPGDFVLDGDPAPPPQRGQTPKSFGPCLLWRNGWMDQDRTWHGHRPEPRRLSVSWKPSPLPKKGAEPPPQFLAHFCCGQKTACIKTEVGLGPGDFVLHGDPAPPPQKGESPPNFQAWR